MLFIAMKRTRDLSVPLAARFYSLYVALLVCVIKKPQLILFALCCLHYAIVMAACPQVPSL